MTYVLMNRPAGPASKEDLDRRAMRLLPDWAKELVREVSARHRVPIREIFGPSKQYPVAAARREAIYRVKAAKPQLSLKQMGAWFDRDHSSILNALARYQQLTGAPALTTTKRNAA